MPRSQPPHPVLSTRTSASHPESDYSGLRVRYRGAFTEGSYMPTLSELAPHTLFLGATGCGKTTAIKLHMASVLPPPNKRFSMRFRSLVYDPKTDLLSFFGELGFHPNETLILTNPFDRRSSAWDVARDVATVADARSFAEVVIQDHPGQEFWQTAARDVVASAVIGLNKTTPGGWDLRDLVLVLDHPNLLKQVLRRTPAGLGVLRDYLEVDPRLAGSIRATVRSNTEPYHLIAALWDHATYSFSFEEWRRTAGLVLIGDHYKHSRAMKRVNNLLVRYAIDTVMDQPGEVRGDITWLYLDELKNAGNFPNFGTMMTQGRSKGIRAVLAVQGLSTLQATFPENEEKEVINNCGNKCVMQLGSEEDAAWAERLFSTTTRKKVSETTPNSSQQGDAGSRTVSENKESLLEAKEFLTMPSASNTGRSITAYYHEPGGLYSTNTVAGHDVNKALESTTARSAEVLGASHRLADFVARGADEMVLRPFGREDYIHLQLTPPEDEPPKPDGGAGQQVDEPPPPTKGRFKMPPPPQD